MDLIEEMKRTGAHTIRRAKKITAGKITDIDSLQYVFEEGEKKSKAIIPADKLVAETVNGLPTDVTEEPIAVAPPKNKLNLRQIREANISSDFQDPKGRFRPVIMGTSGGNINITAGTNGCVFIKNGKPYLLTNRHVGSQYPWKSLSEQPDKRYLQPGPHDGGGNEDNIVGQERYGVLLNRDGVSPNMENIILRAGTKESVDGTIYETQSANTFDSSLIEFTDLGQLNATFNGWDFIPSGWDTVTIGTVLMGTGRTLGLSEGNVTAAGSAVKVDFGNDENGLKVYVYFLDCIETTVMSAGGNSGQIIVRKDNHKIVAQLNAGSATRSIMQPIQHIMTGFGGTPYIEEEMPEPPEPPEPEMPVKVVFDQPVSVMEFRRRSFTQSGYLSILGIRIPWTSTITED